MCFLIGGVQSEVNAERLVAAVMAANEKKCEVTTAGRTQHFNACGYDLEMDLMAIHQDIKRLPFQIEIPGKNP